MISSTVVTNAIRARLLPSSLSDAALLSEWLNTSKGKSRARILELYRELQKFGGDQALYQQQRQAAESAIQKRSPRNAIRRLGEEVQRTWKNLEQRHRLLLKALSRYSFRLGLGYLAISGTKTAGFVAPEEGNAAFAVVNLFNAGELDRIGTCQTCGRWRVVAKSHYRFCSEACRLESYAKDDQFRERKKRNQQNYRKRLKLKHQRQDAAIKQVWRTLTKGRARKEK